MPVLSRLSLGLLVSLLATVSTGQQAFDEIPLKNWAAPPFWSPPPGQQLPIENAREISIERAVAPTVATPAYAFVAIAPCRQYNSLNFTPLLQGVNRSVTLTGAPCGIAAGAVAVSANITVFNIIGAAGNAVFKVDTVSPPLVAWINYPPTEAQRGNAGVVALDGSGQIIVQVAQGGGQIDFVVDVNGYYTATGIVNSLNALNGDVTLAPGTDLSLGAVGQTLTLSANSASTNTANTLVRRDGSGNFSAGTITGNLTGAASANVLKAGDTMTGALVFSPGNINLVTEPSTALSGNILKVGVPFIHDFGSQNIFVGLNAGNFLMTGASNTASGIFVLSSNTTGSFNTASGAFVLSSNTTGNNNTASGSSALGSNTTGGFNTASGAFALSSNTTGNNNTASGSSALGSNTTGGFNTASGFFALGSNTTGFFNTASGVNALFSNTTGSDNTASGYAALGHTTGSSNTASGSLALFSNTTGSDNTASGGDALFSNTTGSHNTASGLDVLYFNTTGNGNTASGESALQNNSGSSNIAIGFSAGLNLTTGDNNVDIGNAGVAAESNTIRIGDPATQTATFIAGINGATISPGVAVFVNSTGQLGTLTSSARFKDDIRDMGEGSVGLLKLRPVSFRYKPELDPTGLEQYGLVAEEVAQVYPDLVTCDDAGQPQAVRYHFLVPMLLNEVQKDRRTIEEQRLGMEAQQLRVQKLEARLERLEAMLSVSAR